MVLTRNKQLNIVSRGDMSVFWERHIVDSLKINDLITKAKTIVDIGSGGGLPGVPLAIMNKDKQFVLVERRRKKVEFLLSVKRALLLSNVTVVDKNFTEIEELDADVFVSRGVKLEESIIKHVKSLSHKSIYTYFKGKQFRISEYRFLKNYSVDEKDGVLIIYL